MSIKSDIYSRLNDAATASPPTLDTAQIYPIIAPQDTDPPYIVFEVISGDHYRDVTVGSVNAVNTRIDITCYARTYKEVDTICNQVRIIMDPHGTDFGVGAISDSSDGYDSDTKLYYQTVEFSTWHREA